MHRRQFITEIKAQVMLALLSGAKSRAERCREQQIAWYRLADWKASFLARAASRFKTPAFWWGSVERTENRRFWWGRKQERFGERRYSRNLVISSLNSSLSLWTRRITLFRCSLRFVEKSRLVFHSGTSQPAA